ncbi:MAG: lactate utilization protein [Dysgonamonadaceae bacterium]|jgi:L-lactate dehydrogenase complex protein LldG|nr:lactate utilization protein [Dysgonamonadaceae bacterium]
MSKQSILSTIRENKPVFPFSPVPEESGCLTEPVKVSDFVSMLEAAGGNIIECNAKDIEGIITDRFPVAVDFTKEDTFAQFSVNNDLSEFEKIEIAIFEGAFGVAENASIWLEDQVLPHRILPFITRHLVLLLDSSNIVPTMHEAYGRIRLADTGYGVFISGPSKTADIEQSLVYGAHGAVRLTVILFTRN